MNCSGLLWTHALARLQHWSVVLMHRLDARRADYRLGFATRRSHISAADDRFNLRRINIQESSTATMR